MEKAQRDNSKLFPPRKKLGSSDGIRVFHVKSPALASEGIKNWSKVGLIRGDHPGCIEKRIQQKLKVPFGACEFDGRVSFASLRNSIFAYVRANTSFQGGGRYVQVTSAPGPTGPWSPFKLLSFQSYDQHNMESGNIYFGAINSNPVDGN